MRPRFTDNTLLHIEGGRHPVVEAVRDVPFIANDTHLDDSRRMLLITGPKWAENQPTCDRMRSLHCSRMLAPLFRHAVPHYPALIVFLRALALR